MPAKSSFNVPRPQFLRNKKVIGLFSVQDFLLCYYFDWISRLDNKSYCPKRKRKVLAKYFFAYQVLFKAGNRKQQILNFLFFINCSSHNGSHLTGVTEHNPMDIKVRRQIFTGFWTGAFWPYMTMEAGTELSSLSYLQILNHIQSSF